MRNFKIIQFIMAAYAIVFLLAACNSTEPMVKQESIIGKTVEEIVQIMTIDEKIGQMTQVDRRYLEDINDIKRFYLGSLLSGGGSTPDPNTPEAWADKLDEYQALASETRLGIPLIYGVDAVHGHSNVVGATIMPHNVGLGATRNPDLVEELSRITAREVRATGINWTFAPCVANSRDERWGRSFESFSEDVTLVTSLSRASVRGLQGTDLSAPDAIAACAKHFIADGGTTYGTGLGGLIDRGDTQIDDTTLRELHLPPYVASIEAGAATIMTSFSSWNGEKCHGHAYLMNRLLKEELGFEGFIVSDWRGIDDLPGDYKSDIIQSITAGMDMIMVPGDINNNINHQQAGSSYKTFLTLFKEAVEDGDIPMERIDDAVMRILKVKESMGLLNSAWHNDRALLATVGSAEHRETSRQAVRESVVMLKNEENILPLSKDLGKIVVAGRGADNVGMQCGGWTISWQGSSGDITPGTTVLEGVQETVSTETEVVHSVDGSEVGGANAVIVVVGEDPYAEMVGDREELFLSQEDLDVIHRVKAADVPYIVVLLSGRPMIITDILENADAFLAAWWPGTEGNGITDIIFGDYAPTGKLPFSWPASMDQIPVNSGDDDYAPLFAFGYGLSFE